jgi:hypothetical protein
MHTESSPTITGNSAIHELRSMRRLLLAGSTNNEDGRIKYPAWDFSEAAELFRRYDQNARAFCAVQDTDT